MVWRRIWTVLFSELKMSREQEEDDFYEQLKGLRTDIRKGQETMDRNQKILTDGHDSLEGKIDKIIRHMHKDD